MTCFNYKHFDYEISLSPVSFMLMWGYTLSPSSLSTPVPKTFTLSLSLYPPPPPPPPPSLPPSLRFSCPTKTMNLLAGGMARCASQKERCVNLKKPGLKVIMIPVSMQLHVVEFQSGNDKYQDIVHQDKIRSPNTKSAYKPSLSVSDLTTSPAVSHCPSISSRTKSSLLQMTSSSCELGLMALIACRLSLSLSLSLSLCCSCEKPAIHENFRKRIGAVCVQYSSDKKFLVVQVYVKT